LKRKPDQVVVHRLELQQKEREMLETYTTAYAVRSWSQPFVAILKDVTASLTIVAILYLVLGDKLNEILPEGWELATSEMNNEQIMDWLEIQNLVGAGIGGVLGMVLGFWLGLFLGPFSAVAGAGAGGIAGAALGSYTVEELEDLNKDRKKVERMAKIAAAIALAHALRRAKETLENPLGVGGGGLWSAVTGN